MGLLDGDLSPGTYGLLGAFSAMSPYLGYTRMPTTGLQALAAAAGGYGEGQLTGAKTSLLGQQAAGLGTQNALNNLTLQGYLDLRRRQGVSVPTAAGAISAAGPAGAPFTSATPLPTVPASYAPIGGPGSTPASFSPAVEDALRDVKAESTPIPNGSASLPGQPAPAPVSQPMVQPAVARPAPVAAGGDSPLFNNADLYQTYLIAARTPGMQNVAQQILSLIQQRIPQGAMPTANGMAPIPGFLPFQAQNAFASGIGKQVAENNKNETVGPGAALLRGPTTLGDAMMGGASNRPAFVNPTSPVQTVVNLQGNSAFWDALGKNLGGGASAVLEGGGKAAQQMQNISAARQMVELWKEAGGSQSLAAPLQAKLSALMQAGGFDPKALGLPADAGPAQALDAITKTMALGKIGGENGLPANNFSEADRDYINDMQANIKNTPSGYEAKLLIAEKAARRSLEAQSQLQSVLASVQPEQAVKAYAAWKAKWDQSVAMQPAFTPEEKARIKNLAAASRNEAPATTGQTKALDQTTLSAAQNAIMRGAPRDKVIQRLKDAGYDVSKF